MSASKPKQPQPTPVTPRLSDVQMEAKDAGLQTRKRAGIEDQILSLGRGSSGSSDSGYSSLLGRSAS